MAGKTLDLTDVLTVDHLATKISDIYLKWDMLRSTKKSDWEEVRKYVFATDTTTTSNSKLPWKNKTTTPKLTQIRDNLAANYLPRCFQNESGLNGKDQVSNQIQWTNAGS